MAKGSRLFKNMALLMIIFPFYPLALNVATGAGLAIGAIDISQITSSAGLVHTSIILVIAASIIQVIAGIMGLANSEKPEKMNSCILVCIIAILLYTAAQIMSIYSGGVHNSLDMVGMIAGFAIPAVFLVGAFEVKAGV